MKGLSQMGVIPTVVSIVAVVLAIIHVAFPHLAVDTTTVLLLGLAALLYYFPEIRKGKLRGGFEWERVIEEKVEKIETEAEPVVIATEQERKEIEPGPIEIGEATTVERFQDNLFEWVAIDPSLALAALRMQLETTVKQILVLIKPQLSEERRFQPFNRMLSILASEGIISPAEQSLAREVYLVSSQAIHGEEVSHHLARRIISAGIDLLGLLAVRREKLERGSPSDPDNGRDS